MKIVFVSFCMLFCFCHLFAQTDNQTSTYNRAIGIKFPGGFAISYKQFLKDNQNVEAQAMFINNGFRAVGLYEWNWDIQGIDGLRWYVGPGAHIGFWNNDYSKKSNNSNAGIGIDGVIGLDYKISDLPINISLDWQPSIDVIGSTGTGLGYGGIGVRYTF